MLWPNRGYFNRRIVEITRMGRSQRRPHSPFYRVTALVKKVVIL